MASEVDATEPRRDDSASPTLSTNTGVTTPSPTNQAHTLDDVFGSSEPESPVQTAAPSSLSAVEAGAVNDLAAGSSQRQKESADIARLRSIHSTTGYRDGLAVARENGLQPGFDEGYSIGAALGLKAGLVVGTFESLQNAVKGVKNAKVKGQLESMTNRCRNELNRSNLLSAEYIDAEGTWKWDAPNDGDLHNIAASHPVVKAWLLKLDVVLHRLGVSNDKLEIRWAEPVPLEEQQVTPKASSMPQARSSDAQSNQTFDF